MTGAFDIMVAARYLAGGRTLEWIKAAIEQLDGVLRVVVCPLSTATDGV
jgi:hypothetical protein